MEVGPLVGHCCAGCIARRFPCACRCNDQPHARAIFSRLSPPPRPAAGPNAPLQWVRATMQGLLADAGATAGTEPEGAAPLASRLLLGLPFYGYDHTDAVVGRTYLELLAAHEPKLKWNSKAEVRARSRAGVSHAPLECVARVSRAALQRPPITPAMSLVRPCLLPNRRRQH